MSINRVVLSGNLTRDPEVRTTQSGMPVMSLGIAVNDRRKNNQTGEWEDYANFIDCTMFGTRAQNVANYLSKGQRVMIEGKLRYSQWERDGQKRSKIEVIIDDLDFSGSRGGNNNQGGYGGGQNSYGGGQGGYGGNNAAAYSAPSTPVVDTNSSVYDEDIPF